MSLRAGLLDLRPLHSSPPFRRLFGSGLLGALGGQVATVAILFQVWELTHDPFWTGAIGLANAIPRAGRGQLPGASRGRATSAPIALASGGLACAAVVGWIALRNAPLRSFSIRADAGQEAEPAHP